MLLLGVIKELFRLLAYMLPLMFIGLYLANVLSKSKQFGRIGAIMNPLSRVAKLPEGCSPVFSLCLLNKVAGFSMLSELNRKKVLSDTEVIITSMVASLPLCIHFSIFFIGPLSLSMLGVSVGMAFIATYFITYLLRAVIGIFTGRLLLKAKADMVEVSEIHEDARSSSWKNVLYSSLVDTIPPFRKVLRIIVPTLLIAVFLINFGILDSLLPLTSPLTQKLGLPASSFLIIIAGFPSMMVGIATAGPLVVSGGIMPLEAIIALVITSLFHRLYELCKSSLPINVSIFGSKLGAKITAVAFLMEFASLPVLAILIGLR